MINEIKILDRMKDLAEEKYNKYDWIEPLARDSRVSRVTIRNWMEHKSFPTINKLESCLKVLGYELRIMKAKDKQIDIEEY